MGGGDDDAGEGEDKESDLAESEPAEAVEDAAYKELCDAVADEEDANGELYLDAADMEAGAHAGEGGYVNVNGKAGEWDECEGEDGGDAVVFFFDGFGGWVVGLFHVVCCCVIRAEWFFEGAIVRQVGGMGFMPVSFMGTGMKPGRGFFIDLWGRNQAGSAGSIILW